MQSERSDFLEQTSHGAARDVAMLIVLAGGLLSLLVLSRAASELRRRIKTEEPSEKPPLDWGALLLWGPYWIIWAILAHWRPEAQIPFVLLWFGCIALGLVVLLIVRSRRRRQP
jgi:drug/metabolite transporter (DMT)-like permease